MEDFSRLPHPHASRSQISLVKQEEKGGGEEEEEGRRKREEEVRSKKSKELNFSTRSVGAAGNQPSEFRKSRHQSGRERAQKER